MLAYYFPPRGGSGVQRSLKFAKYLPHHGFDPVVISVTEDEITETREEDFLGEIPDVSIYRAASGERRIRTLARLKLGPLVSMALRPDAHILWRKSVLRLAGEVIPKHKCEAIYASVQPWSAAVIGADLKRLHGLPLIVDFRDPWSLSTSQAWPSRWHYRRDCRQEERIFREADAIVSVTPGIIDGYRERYPWAAEKIHLVYNGFDHDDFAESPDPATTSKGGPLRIAFAGRLYGIRGKDNSKRLQGLRSRIEYRNCSIDFTTHSLRYLLEAIAGIVKANPSARDDLLVDVAGNVPNDNRAYAEELEVGDLVRFHGMLPHSETIDLVGRSDAVFLPMMSETDGRRSFNASGKVFEYLAHRKPIIAAVPEGDAADLVREARCGWVVGGRDVAGQQSLLSDLLQWKREGRFGIKPHGAFIEKFERKALAGQLAQILKEVIMRNKPEEGRAG